MTFQILNDVVKAIIATIENAAVTSVKALKAHTFSTKVTNLPEVQKVSGKVEVTNQANVEGKLTRIEKSISSLTGVVSKMKAPKSIEVENFPKYPSFPEFPKEIEVSNFPKQEKLKEISVSNQPIRELEAIKSKIGEMVTAVGKIKFDPKIEVQAPKPERLVVPPANVTVTQQEIDYEKLATAIAEQIPNFDYKKFGEVIADKVNISVSGGSGGKYAYKNADGSGATGLVDGDRHVQVDVLTMPSSEVTFPEIQKIQEQEFPPTDPSKLNASLSITEATVGDVTTTTLVKTVGATTYTKTIAKNNVTKAVTVSSWS